MTENIQHTLSRLARNMDEREQQQAVPFERFLEIMVENPQTVIRNVFQVFHDMIRAYVGEGVDEYPNDPESVHFSYYDCDRLFVEGSDHPFFADRLFANRLITHVEALKRGTQQNKIYIFDGPPGCGKSTFLNNLLKKFETYANTAEGSRFEVVWHLDRKLFGSLNDPVTNPLLSQLAHLLNQNAQAETGLFREPAAPFDGENFNSHEPIVEIPCPSHDHPILVIPKRYRRALFDDLFGNTEFKWRLFNDKEYEWVFKDKPCTICSALYQALLSRLGDPEKIFGIIHARQYRFNRRLGEGISVFNPGDRPARENIHSNPILQRRINTLLRDSNQVKYLFSQYAKTNNGIYALMDIKSHNIDRLIELHNIISEGVHKVEDIEENVNSLFLALMNPEDKKNIRDIQSFADRIEYIKLPYVLDLRTEVEIYRNIFGKHIDDGFLPRVLHNFARVIISSRLNTRSEALLEWIRDPAKYRRYCDENLQLLKMELYTGHIPAWLNEEDRKALNAKRRRRILAESENEGQRGFSGRDSIKIFNDFYSTYAKEDKLINMSMLYNYFTNVRKDLNRLIPDVFLDSLIRLYDYTVLQEVKESLYYYNEEQISRDIKNYLFAVNFEPGAVEKCTFTDEKLEISEEFFRGIENRLLGAESGTIRRKRFRQDTQKEYASRTLTQEILVEGKDISETDIYHAMHERYVHNLKQKVLEPFLENENFRQAIKDYGNDEFKTYDKRIRDDVSFLMKNLCEKSRYTEKGAKEVCMYVIDNNLAQKFDIRD